jgi:putative oxidoreductase
MKERLDGMALLGRILLATLFIWSGWGKLIGFSDTAGFIGSQGLPMPQVLAAIAVAVELGGGILLLIGLKARWVALALVVFLIVITPIFHNYWDAPAAQARLQEINFMKNIAIMGGMFMVAAFGPGRFSIDRA